VQSVALRLICEREREVESFIPDEYWTLDADFKKGRSEFSAQLVQYRDAKPELGDEQAVRRIIDEIEGKPCEVADIKTTEKTIRPKAPFTTSKLQQMAANRLGFTSKKTMQIAQQLYEGVNVDPPASVLSPTCERTPSASRRSPSTRCGSGSGKSTRPTCRASPSSIR
jgi:DNA topoisomerase-1